MNLSLLHVFCMVYDKRSFSKAAEALYITQPTVSAHIKTLEEELDVVLFDRVGRTTEPTKAGQLLYAYARRIEKLRAEASVAMENLRGKVKGHLDIGGSTIPGEYLLPSLIGRFQKTYPDITATLKIGDTKEIAEMVSSGALEAAIVGAPADERKLVNDFFAEDELILIAPESFEKTSLTIEEFKETPLIFRERGSGSRMALEEWLEGNGLSHEDMKIVSEMGSTEALKQAVRSGLGLTIVSRLAVRDDLSFGVVREVSLPGLPLKRSLYVIYHRTRSRSHICSAFLEFLAAESRIFVDKIKK